MPELNSTNLTTKFEDLRTQMTAQHNAVILAIGACQVELSTKLTGVNNRLDTIIDKLDGIQTTLTSQGTFDTTPIVQALNANHAVQIEALLALRGEGPENTIRSLNQSIWNMVGAAPGATLVEILAALTTANGYWAYGSGIRPYNLLDAIYTSIAGNTGSDNTALLQKIVDTLGDPSVTAPTGYTVRYLLYLLLQQFDTSVVTPTIKDILLNLQTLQTQLAANPLTTLPVGVCDEPFTSTYTAVLPVSGVSVTNITVAGWDFSQTAEFERGEILGLDGDILIKTTHEPIDWSGYRFYVASKAQMFGAVYLDPQRWPTNQWVTLPYKQSLSFTVDGDNDDLKVYICPQSSEPTTSNCTGASGDPIITSAWTNYKTYDGHDQFNSWNVVGYNGGITWSVDATLPITPPMDAFTINNSGTVHLCISSNVVTAVDMPLGSYFHMVQYRKVGNNYVWNGGTPLPDINTVGQHSIQVAIDNQQNDMYILMLYTPTERESAPNATLSIDIIEAA